MGRLVLAAFVLLTLWTRSHVRAEDDLGDWEVSLANRQLDLASNQARQTLTLTINNVCKQSLSAFYVAVDGVLAGKVAYIGAHVSMGLGIIWNLIAGVRIFNR